MKRLKPERNALNALRIIVLILSAVLIGLVKIYIPIEIVFVVFTVATVSVDVFMIFIYMPIYFSSLNYDVSDEKIIKHSGVFCKSHQSVRYSTVQYSTVITTPLSYITGLNFVVLFVYGGSLRLVFLDKDDAMYILARCSDVS